MNHIWVLLKVSYQKPVNQKQDFHVVLVNMSTCREECSRLKEKKQTFGFKPDFVSGVRIYIKYMSISYLLPVSIHLSSVTHLCLSRCPFPRGGALADTLLPSYPALYYSLAALRVHAVQ